MRVIIDDREHALCGAMSIAFEKKRLDLADIVIRYEDRAALAIERKTVSDLTASLRDGRFQEQRSRLLETFGHERVVYIIEGGQEVFEMAQEAGALLALTFRDRVAVIRTTCVRGTARAVEKLVSLTASERLQQRECPPVDDAAYIKARRMPTDTAPAAFVAMLCVIPGVSKAKALSIQGRYPTMKVLCEEIAVRRTVTASTLSDIRCGKNRIGNAVAAKVVMSLHCDLQT